VYLLYTSILYLNSVVRLFLFFTFQSIPIAFNRCRCLCAFYCQTHRYAPPPPLSLSHTAVAPLDSPVPVPCQQICAESHQLAGIVSDITRTRSWSCLHFYTLPPSFLFPHFLSFSPFPSSSCGKKTAQLWALKGEKHEKKKKQEQEQLKEQKKIKNERNQNRIKLVRFA